MIKQWLSAIILSAVSKIRRLNGRQITPSLTSQIMKTIQDSISKMEILLRKIKMGFFFNLISPTFGKLENLS